MSIRAFVPSSLPSEIIVAHCGQPQVVGDGIRHAAIHHVPVGTHVLHTVHANAVLDH